MPCSAAGEMCPARWLAKSTDTERAPVSEGGIVSRECDFGKEALSRRTVIVFSKLVHSVWQYIWKDYSWCCRAIFFFFLTYHHQRFCSLVSEEYKKLKDDINEYHR